MKTLIVCAVSMAGLLFLGMSPSVAQNVASPVSVPSATAGPEGFIVVKGIIYAVQQGRASVLPDSLRWTGTARGVDGFPRAIQELQPGFMLTTEGKVVPAPANVVFSNNAMGTVAPVNDTNNATDNTTTRATDNSIDNSTTRATDNSIDNRTTRATSNTIDNRTTRATNNATSNATTNGSR